MILKNETLTFQTWGEMYECFSKYSSVENCFVESFKSDILEALAFIIFKCKKCIYIEHSSYGESFYIDVGDGEWEGYEDGGNDGYKFSVSENKDHFILSERTPKGSVNKWKITKDFNDCDPTH